MITLSSAHRNGVWFSVAVNRKGKLVACAFSDRNRREAERSLTNSLSKLKGAVRGNRGVEKSFRLLTKFYNGKGDRSGWKNVDLSGVSVFRRDVYRMLCRIPKGKVTTYGAIAKRVRGKRFARAVGTAVATNPLPLIVPCHRVVPSSGKVGNYGMGGRKPSSGGYMKRMLLDREGVIFQGEKVSKRSMWVPNPG